MKRLISSVLLLLAVPMLIGGMLEIEGLAGTPSLWYAIALSLGSQAVTFAAGNLAPPPKGKTGFFRAAAFGLFFLQSVPVAMAAFAVFYRHFVGVELLEPAQLTHQLVTSISALLLLLISAKMWSLSIWRSRKTNSIQE